MKRQSYLQSVLHVIQPVALIHWLSVDYGMDATMEMALEEGGSKPTAHSSQPLHHDAYSSNAFRVRCSNIAALTSFAEVAQTIASSMQFKVVLKSNIMQGLQNLPTNTLSACFTTNSV